MLNMQLFKPRTVLVIAVVALATHIIAGGLIHNVGGDPAANGA